MQFPKPIVLFHASVIRGIAKESRREYFCIQGKQFPDQQGYGDNWFFDRAQAPDKEDATIKSPFNQDSTIEVLVTSSGKILEVKVVYPGRYPAQVKDLEQVFAKAKARKEQGTQPAQQPAQNQAPVVAPDFKRVS